MMHLCVQPLPGDVTHTYVFPAEAWEAASRAGGIALDAVPFTHAAHVPRLVELLRHQCAINTLLRSCMSQSPGRQDGAKSPRQKFLKHIVVKFQIAIAILRSVRRLTPTSL